jgi:hypothetical protein
VSSRSFLTPGAAAADRWLSALHLPFAPRWHAEIAILADGDSRFDLNMYAEEWGFAFQHGARASWIRFTDIPFAHGRDDFQLLAKATDPLAIHALLAELEHAHRITFRRAVASVRTNVPGAAEAVRDWLLETSAQDVLP